MQQYVRTLSISTCIWFICVGCIEPYEFLIEDNEPSLVVEGYISNVSYADSRAYPADGRYFTIKLSSTSAVTNVRGEAVSNAIVKLVDDTGQQWSYRESQAELGSYLLEVDDFRALADRSYKLQISLADGMTYESEWEKIQAMAPPMGNIGFEEVEKQVYLIEMGEQVVKTIKGVNVYIDLPKNDSGQPYYYRWNFRPWWIYIAPLAFSSQPNYKCWATNRNYLSGYTLQTDYVGGYRKSLFFMETIRNERIFEKLSVLVEQQVLSEDLYSFWQEMQEQVEGDGLFEKPPYNLQTNLKAVGHEAKVSGYFGVVNEQAQRWYFSIDDLSYYVENTLKPDCEVGYGGPPAPSCISCLDYNHGTAINIKPEWWQD